MDAVKLLLKIQTKYTWQLRKILNEVQGQAWRILCALAVAYFPHHQSLISSTSLTTSSTWSHPNRQQKEIRYIKKFARLEAPPGLLLATGRAKGAPGGMGTRSGTMAAAMGTTRLAGTGPLSVVEKFLPSIISTVTSMRARWSSLFMWSHRTVEVSLFGGKTFSKPVMAL
jgi:hypothetical protein